MYKVYGLTDGTEIYAVKVMTYEEFCSERRVAAQTSAGNVNWEVLSETPVSQTLRMIAPKVLTPEMIVVP